MTIFECTKCKLTWFLKEIEVYRDFDLRHEEGQFKSLEALADAKRALKNTYRKFSRQICQNANATLERIWKHCTLGACLIDELIRDHTIKMTSGGEIISTG